LAVTAPVDCEPVMALAPDHPPEAEQEAALAADHVSREFPPLVIELGAALKETVGACAFTDTDADCTALPPAPLQVRVKVEFVVNAPVDWEP